jgi:putative flippase GtrA
MLKHTFDRLRSAARPGGSLPLARWLFAGLVFMGLNTLFLKALIGWLGLRPMVGTLCAGELATLLRYLVNDRWVFGHQKLSWLRLWQYHLANAGALALWWIGTNIFISMGINYLIAGILAIAFSTGFSMASNFYWIWRKKHPAPRSGP